MQYVKVSKSGRLIVKSYFKLSSLASVVEFLNQMNRNRRYINKLVEYLTQPKTVEHTIYSFSSEHFHTSDDVYTPETFKTYQYRIYF